MEMVARRGLFLPNSNQSVLREDNGPCIHNPFKSGGRVALQEDFLYFNLECH